MKILLAYIFSTFTVLSLVGQSNFDVRLMVNNDVAPPTLSVQIQKSTAGDVAESTRVDGMSFNLTSGSNFIDGPTAISSSIALSHDSANDIIGNTTAGSQNLPELPSGRWVEVALFQLMDGDYTADQFTINPTTTDFVNAAFIAVNGFTPGGELLNIQASILPVEFSYFKARKENDGSLLTWETTSEINNDYFDVERSADGKSFERIGKVKGHGTTTETQNYEFLDRAPLAGLNYYRLKQVDFNGEYEYSKIETVDFRDGTEGDIRIFPNPAVDFVNVTLDRKYDQVRVTNQSGQLVEILYGNDWRDNQLKLNVVDYTPGVYYLEAKIGTELVNKQFVKVK